MTRVNVPGVKDTVLDFMSLENINSIKNKNPKKALKELTAEFESLIWYQILKDMDKTIIKSNLLPENLEYKFYKDFLYQEIARKVSGQKGGLGDFLYNSIVKSPYFKAYMKEHQQKGQNIKMEVK